MENAGGINEIYNFYVGQTLQNSYNKASAAFNAKLNQAKGADITSQAAINSISMISQATANMYINQGAAAAMSVGSTWGCQPGALTKAAITTFASNVNAARASTNSQISAVKSNKQKQHNEYAAEIARLEAAKARLADQLRKKYGIVGPYTTDYIIAKYAPPEISSLLFSANWKSYLDVKNYIGYINDLGEVAKRVERYCVDGFNVVKDGKYAIIKGARSASALEEGILGTRYALKNAAQYPNVFKYTKAITAGNNALNIKTLGGKLGALGVVLDTGFGVVNNINNGATAQKTTSDAVVDVAFGVGTIWMSAAAGATFGSVVPGPGNVIGAGIGFLTGLAIYLATDVIEINGMSLRDWTKTFLYGSVEGTSLRSRDLIH
jgi:hypothetical protein